MAGHFTITADTGQLARAESLLAQIGSQLGEEGRKLSGLPGQAGDWTGRTASTLKTEMRRIGQQMASSVTPFETARAAITTLRVAIDDATQHDLPRLNTRWDEAVAAHEVALGAAAHRYSVQTQPLRHLPPSDADTARQGAGQARARAAQDADANLTGTQRALNEEYDLCVLDLQRAARRCGQALAGAVLAAVPAAVVSAYVRGGGTGTLAPLGFDLDALTVGTRQALTGDDSLAGQADDYAAGRRAAQQTQAWLRDHRADDAPQSVLDALKANSTNQAFAQGLIATLGPSGTARLAGEVQVIARAGRDRGNELFTAMSQTFAAGSHAQVDDGHGGVRYLMDAGWLGQFSPTGADPTWAQSDPPDQYRPDLLLPFLRRPGVSENFATVVAERALSDYEKYWKNEDTRDFNGFRWYLGRYATEGNPWAAMSRADPNDPWGPVFHVALARAGDYTGSSNTILMRHLDTVMGLSTGQAPNWTGGQSTFGNTPNLAGPALATILRQGTTGLLTADPTQAALSDSIVSQVGAWLGNHHDQHLIGDARTTLTDVLINDRYITGVTNSLGTPFAPSAAGYDPVTGVIVDPSFGPLMPVKVWTSLHQEAMRSPQEAARIVTTLGNWIISTGDDAQHHSYTYGPSGERIVSPEVASLDLFRAEKMRSFLAENLIADQDALQSEMERKLQENEAGKEQAKAVLTSLFGYATSPASIGSDLVGKGGSFIIDAVVDGTIENPQLITSEYQGTIDDLHELAGSEVTKPGVWKEVHRISDNLANDSDENAGAQQIFAPQEGYDEFNPAHPTHYDGNPSSYVGKASEVSGGIITSDDFLIHSIPGSVTGVMKVEDMNHLQRAAYLRWLRDPAIQSYLNKSQRAIEEARVQAGR
jgi:hypothetical protein